MQLAQDPVDGYPFLRMCVEGLGAKTQGPGGEGKVKDAGAGSGRSPLSLACAWRNMWLAPLMKTHLESYIFVSSGTYGSRNTILSC